MHDLEFTAEELSALGEVLQHQIAEMEIEVRRTDTHDYREMLKHRRQVLENVLAKLSDQPVGALRSRW